MALEAGFVAAVLESIEWTQKGVIERGEISELPARRDVLRRRIRALRVSIEPAERRAEAECCEEAVGLQR